LDGISGLSIVYFFLLFFFKTNIAYVFNLILKFRIHILSFAAAHFMHI